MSSMYLKSASKNAIKSDRDSDLNGYSELLESVDQDEQILNVVQENVTENTSILFGLGRTTISTSQRRSKLKNVEVLQKIEIGPDLLISGDFFGPGLDLYSFRINMGIDLGNFEQYINGQPIRFMAKSISTGIIFFLVEFDRV